MARTLEGLHAVITGGGRGIGAAIATALANDGARLTLLGRNLQNLRDHAAQLPDGAHVASCDVSDAEAVQAAFADARKACGPVHLLINNAGAAQSAPLERTSIELWQSMLAVNLTGTFLCMQAALPDMRAAGHGRIVNIASTAAQRGYAYVAAYCAAKHGVLGLTRAAALETARQGITVNAVCPGYTETDLLHDSIARVVARTGRSEAQAREAFESSNPQGRLIQPGEVAELVRWLCGPAAASITGQALSVCGGEVM